ncbi:MAG: parallel beta-helix domain-containing protein [Pseudomonadota bacterium]|nr:parallel beta-helix domain-containing protein [Pseudomonadota bacterium]
MKAILLLGTLLLLVGCDEDVSDSESIRRWFVDASNGSTLTIPAGNFEFDRSLVLRANNIAIVGAGQESTVLSFRGQRQGAEGILLAGNGIRIEGLAVEDTVGDAIKINQSRDVVIRDVRTEWTRGPHTDNGAYGIYPVQCENVLIEESSAIGASDAGIYVGQSQHIIVRNSVARHNVAGIEIENSTDADVYGNYVTENTGGILVFDLPNLPVQGGRRTRVFDNDVQVNNTPNFAPPGNTVAGVPAGTGIMISANDDIEVFGNRLIGNDTANMLVVSYLITGNPLTDTNYDPYPERIHIHDNVFEGGGVAPDSDPLKRLVEQTETPVPDIVWDGFSRDGENPQICIDGNGTADFVNLGAPASFVASFDLGPHRCRLDALATIDLAELTAM